MLDRITDELPSNTGVWEYAGKVIDFFNKQSEVVPEKQVWIGSSEIIESFFGKLKSLEQDQSKGGFTSLVLEMAASVGSLDPCVIEEAMVKVKTKEVEAWVKSQIGESFLSKRRKAFQSKKRKSVKKAGRNGDKKIIQNLAGIYPSKVVGF